MLKCGRMWAITCVFSPAGFRSRNQNYRIFRDHLRLPLLAVELAWDAPFSLAEGDAEILIQLRGGAKLWQKERLLNIALQHLPEECDSVAWLDADILFRNENWTEIAADRLEEVPIAQAFTLVRYLTSGIAIERTRPGAAQLLACGALNGAAFEASMERSHGSPSPGHAWVARREFLDRFSLYDGCIAGGGDTALFCALSGDFNRVIGMHCMAEAQIRRYLDWAEPVNDEVRANIGYVPGVIDHLWHGSMLDRHGKARHRAVRVAGFNPERDLRIGENGAWHWNSDNIELQDYLSTYFGLRNEDADYVEPSLV